MIVVWVESNPTGTIDTQYHTVLHNITQHDIVLRCATLHYDAVPPVALRSFMQYYAALRSITQRYAVLLL